MSIAIVAQPARTAARAPSPALVRALALLLSAGALAAGFLLTGHAQAAAAAARKGADLTHLLRAMAALKLLFAAAATGGILWRLGSPARPAWLAAYALSLAALWSGPGLVWNLAHLGLGALLLHGGLIASLVLLWRDPIAGARLQSMIDARRLALKA